LRARVALLALGALLCFARGASADWHVAPFVGYTFLGSTTVFDPEDGAGKPHFNAGASVARVTQGLFGVEALFVYTPDFFRGEGGSVGRSRSLALMGNVVLTIPRRLTEYSLRPFVSGGAGLIDISLSEAFFNISSGSESVLGYNVGGGAVGFLSETTGVRFDLRYFGTLRGSTPDSLLALQPVIRVRYWTGTIGLVLRY
jgi:hypothetical protein